MYVETEFPNKEDEREPLLVELANEPRESLELFEALVPIDDRSLPTPNVIALSALPLRAPNAPIPARFATLLVPEEFTNELLEEPEVVLIVPKSASRFLKLSTALTVLRTENVGL